MLGVTIGEWALARDVSEWIEIVAIAAIVIGVVGALVKAVAINFGKTGAGLQPLDEFRKFSLAGCSSALIC